jgi:hypothetical protein
MESMNDEEKKDKPERKIKSIIIDSELKEWEEWGNRYFGDDLYHEDDLNNRKRR